MRVFQMCLSKTLIHFPLSFYIFHYIYALNKVMIYFLVSRLIMSFYLWSMIGMQVSKLLKIINECSFVSMVTLQLQVIILLSSLHLIKVLSPATAVPKIIHYSVTIFEPWEPRLPAGRKKNPSVFVCAPVCPLVNQMYVMFWGKKHKQNNYTITYFAM